MFRLSGTNKSVHPDVVLVATSMNYVLLTEAKSGTSVDPEQMRKCQSLKPEDIALHISLADPKQLRHESMVVCNASDLIWVSKTYNDAGVNVPIIAISNDEVSLGGGQFVLQELNDAFKIPIKVTSEMAPPTNWVPFDSASETGDVVEVIMPQIIKYMHRDLPRFSTNQLINDLYGDYISLLSDHEMKEVRGSVDKVLKEATKKKYLREYVSRESGRFHAQWEIKKNPFDMDPAHQSKSLEAIKRRTERLIADLKNEPWPPEQLQFYWD